MSNMEIDIDAKELADRMAAAEAMSALSAVVLVNKDGDSPASSRHSERIASRGAKGTTKTRKTRAGGRKVNADTKKSRSRTTENHDTTKANVTESDKNKPARVTSRSKGGSQETVPKRSPRRKSKASLSETEGPGNNPKTKSQSSVVEDTQAASSQPNLPSFPSNFSLTLPSLSIPTLGTLPTLSSLTFLQTDVQSAGEKGQSVKDNKSLPFKKRRLINEGEDGEETEAKPDDSKSQNQDPPPVSSSSSGTVRIPIDPALNLRLFTEIHAALTADEDGDIPLHLAVVHEHLPLVQKFIQLMKIAKRSVDRFNKDKQTPLHLAVKLNFQDGVKALLEAGADVNYVDKTGCSSLHLAIKHQYLGCLQLLTKHTKVKPDFDVRNFEGLTPLHTAVENRSMAMINFILDYGVDVNMMDGKSGRTPLFHAAENNNVDIVETLVKRGASADIPNYAGSTAIMAAQARNLNIVTKILSRASEWEDQSGGSSPAPEVNNVVPENCQGNGNNNRNYGISNHPLPLVKSSVKQHEGASAAVTTASAAAATSAAAAPASTPNPAALAAATAAAMALPVRSLPGSRRNSNNSPLNMEISLSRSMISEETGIQETANDLRVQRSNAHRPLDKSLTSEIMKKLDESPRDSRIRELREKFDQQYRQISSQMQTSPRSERKSGSPKSSKTVDSRNDLPSRPKENFPDSTARISPLTGRLAESSARKLHVESSQANRNVEENTTVSNTSHIKSKDKEVTEHVMAKDGRTVVTSLKGERPSEDVKVTSTMVRVSRPESVISHTSSVGISESTSTISNSHPNVSSHLLAIPRKDGRIPQTVSTTSNSVAPLSKLSQALTTQPERVISTGMVIDHPQFGLVFKPFGRLEGLDPEAGIRLTETPGSGSQKVPGPKETENVPSPPRTKLQEAVTEPPVLTKMIGEPRVGAARPPKTIPQKKESSRSKEKNGSLLTTSGPNSSSKNSDSVTKSNESGKTKQTNLEPTLGKTIANSAIAAKLRQRVLNAPQMDHTAKALANAAVAAASVPTSRAIEPVTTAPERVPRLPQFSTQPPNIQPSPPLSKPSEPARNSKIIEHLSRPIIESFARPSDVSEAKMMPPIPNPSKTNAAGGKKPERKRKKKEKNGKDFEDRQMPVLEPEIIIERNEEPMQTDENL